jgi:predicted TPR repeat methyltransferase
MPRSEYSYNLSSKIHLAHLQSKCCRSHSKFACSFEHSLVEDLGYTGYERLRQGFDRALGDTTTKFSLVLDAGCGTGLVGEQVSESSI